jgi:hypothetical protein
MSEGAGERVSGGGGFLALYLSCSGALDLVMSLCKSQSITCSCFIGIS